MDRTQRKISICVHECVCVWGGGGVGDALSKGVRLKVGTLAEDKYSTCIALSTQ